MAFQRMSSFQQEAIEIHPNHLYFWVTRRGESGRVAASSGLLLHIDNELKYEPFANDFGPLHLGCTYRFCKKLSFLLKVCFLMLYWDSDVRVRHLNVSFNTFQCYPHAEYVNPSGCTSWLDTTKATSLHCNVVPPSAIHGIYKAKQVGFIDWHLPHSSFNLKKYEFYEQVINGDWNWILPTKFLAFSGPTCRSREQSMYGTLGTHDYVPLFKQEAVTGIVRLNKAQYDKRDFTAAGFSHYDLYFPDGTTPPLSILQTFLSIAETEPGAIAVHCKAGLGRTGTLIGCYMMKHFGFTAPEVIAYIRLCRPGSILGLQQIYLHEQQARMWQAGNHQGQPIPRSVAQNPLGTVPASQSAPSRSRSVSISSSQSRATLPPAVASYTSNPLASMGSMPHPASGGLAALDSVPSSSAAQLQRFTSMPARGGSSISAPLRSPSVLLSRRSDMSGLDSAEKDMANLSVSKQQAGEGGSTEQPSHVVTRTLAPNGQPRKVLASSTVSAPPASTEASIGTQPASVVGFQREVRRTASNGQPRKGLCLTQPVDSRQGQFKSHSFRNR